MDIFALAGLIFIVVIPIALIMWSQQKKQIGTIRCRRCNYVGPAKGLFVPFRGIKPVCQKCQSEDWVAEQASRPQSNSAMPVPPSSGARTGPASAPAKRQSGFIKSACPKCLFDLQIPQGYVGKRVLCPKCNSPLHVSNNSISLAALKADQA